MFPADHSGSNGPYKLRSKHARRPERPPIILYPGQSLPKIQLENVHPSHRLKHPHILVDPL